jgi:hypothetical protein
MTINATNDKKLLLFMKQTNYSDHGSKILEQQNHKTRNLWKDSCCVT